MDVIMEAALPKDRLKVEKTSSTKDLKALSHYRSIIKPNFTAEEFRPVPTRLFMGLFYFILAGGAATLIFLDMPWFVKVVCSFVIGICWCASGFMAHEILHGSVVKGRWLQDALAFVCFTPWLISPSFWRYWHNHMHHGYTQQPLRDPDAYPTLRLFKQSKLAQWIYRLTPGSRGIFSRLYLLYFFSFNMLLAQLYFRFQGRHKEGFDQIRCSLELAVMVALWAVALYYMTLPQFVFLVLLVLPVQNYFAMSYIVTNHNVMPLTSVNDPLANSLTVTSHPLIEKFFINFGYHVEHHLFADMSSVHYKKVHALLKKEFGAQFKHMPKSEALARVWATPRIYKDSTTLIHPTHGDTHPTL